MLDELIEGFATRRRTAIDRRDDGALDRDGVACNEPLSMRVCHILRAAIVRIDVAIDRKIGRLGLARFTLAIAQAAFDDSAVPELTHSGVKPRSLLFRR